MQNRREVLLHSREECIDTQHFVALREELLAQVRSEKAGAAGYQDPLTNFGISHVITLRTLPVSRIAAEAAESEISETSGRHAAADLFDLCSESIDVSMRCWSQDIQLHFGRVVWS